MNPQPSIGAQLHAQLAADHPLAPVAQTMLLDRLNTADRALTTYLAYAVQHGLSMGHPEVQAHVRVRMERLERARDEAEAAGLLSILRPF